ASGAGRLYAWNTCGGALGALGCGVVAIRVLGVRGTFLAAAGLDAAVAAAALALARRTAAPAARRETGAGGAPPRLALVLAGAAAPGCAMGRVLAANTAGGIAGALGAAFVLLPRLGLGGGLLATAGIAALAALATRRTAGALAAAAVALAALASPSFRLPWRAGDERILFYRDGA